MRQIAVLFILVMLLNLAGCLNLMPAFIGGWQAASNQQQQEEEKE